MTSLKIVICRLTCTTWFREKISITIFSSIWPTFHTFFCKLLIFFWVWPIFWSRKNLWNILMYCQDNFLHFSFLCSGSKTFNKYNRNKLCLVNFLKGKKSSQNFSRRNSCKIDSFVSMTIPNKSLKILEELFFR